MTARSIGTSYCAKTSNSSKSRASSQPTSSLRKKKDIGPEASSMLFLNGSSQLVKSVCIIRMVREICYRQHSCRCHRLDQRGRILGAVEIKYRCREFGIHQAANFGSELLRSQILLLDHLDRAEILEAQRTPTLFVFVLFRKR